MPVGAERRSRCRGPAERGVILSKKETRMAPGNEIIPELKYYEIETINLSAVSCNKIFDYWYKCCYY